jgi:hypothetical protein
MAALASQGMQIVASSPTEPGGTLRADFKKWGDVNAAPGTTTN